VSFNRPAVLQVAPEMGQADRAGGVELHDIPFIEGVQRLPLGASSSLFLDERHLSANEGGRPTLTGTPRLGGDEPRGRCRHMALHRGTVGALASIKPVYDAGARDEQMNPDGPSPRRRHQTQDMPSLHTDLPTPTATRGFAM
jgi:hypothetical protein